MYFNAILKFKILAKVSESTVAIGLKVHTGMDGYVNFKDFSRTPMEHFHSFKDLMSMKKINSQFVNLIPK